MDVLTDVLAAAQAGRPHSVLTLGRAPWALAFQRSPSAHFHVVTQGTCHLLTAGEPTGRTLTPGDVVLLPRGVPHVLADPPATRPVPIESLPLCLTPGATTPLLELGGTSEHPDDADGRPGRTTTMLCGAYLLHPALRPHPLLSALPEVVYLPSSRGTHPHLHAAVDLLAAELQQPRPGGTTVIDALVNALLAYVLRAWYEDQTARSPAWAALADPAVGAALARIHQAPARPWTVAGLAAETGLSRAAFARRFTALMGEPPLTYLTRWRMTHAQQLLRGGNATLSTVARKVGYDSQFAFAKAFKRYVGESPGRYRVNTRTDQPTPARQSATTLAVADSSGLAEP